MKLCWSHIPHCWKSHALAQLCTISLPLDTLISRGNQLLTGSVGKNVRIWSVVGVGEMRLPGENYNVRSVGLTMEDEMNLDGAIVSATFDEAMDMVSLALCTAVPLSCWTSVRYLAGHLSGILKPLNIHSFKIL